MSMPVVEGRSKSSPRQAYMLMITQPVVFNPPAVLFPLVVPWWLGSPALVYTPWQLVPDTSAVTVALPSAVYLRLALLPSGKLTEAVPW